MVKPKFLLALFIANGLFLTAFWILFYLLYVGYNVFISLGIALITLSIFEIGVKLNEH